MKNVNLFKGNDVRKGLRQLAKWIDTAEYPEKKETFFDLQYFKGMAIDRNTGFACFAWGPNVTLETLKEMTKAMANELDAPPA